MPNTAKHQQPFQPLPGRHRLALTIHPMNATELYGLGLDARRSDKRIIGVGYFVPLGAWWILQMNLSGCLRVAYHDAYSCDLAKQTDDCINPR